MKQLRCGVQNVLGRLLAMLFEWYDATAYLPDGTYVSLLEALSFCCRVAESNVLKKLISLQHRVRARKSHIQNSTNHFFLG